jgi:hypothetical protein
MTQVTVKQLADEVKTPVERLLQQMREAGLPHTAAEEGVTDSEKQSLLTHLKSSHKAKVEEPRKITLQRKTTSTLRVAGSKSISVEVRKKKVFVQRSPEEIEAERKRELEERRAVENAARQKAEEEAKRRAEEEARRQPAAAPTAPAEAVAAPAQWLNLCAKPRRLPLLRLLPTLASVTNSAVRTNHVPTITIVVAVVAMASAKRSASCVGQRKSACSTRCPTHYRRRKRWLPSWWSRQGQAEEAQRPRFPEPNRPCRA